VGSSGTGTGTGSPHHPHGPHTTHTGPTQDLRPMLAACHPAAATQLVCAPSSIAAAPTPISLPCCHQAAAHLPLAPLRKCL